jgi:Putative primosome component and related proteins
MSYINSVLNNWYSLGLTTGKAVLAYQREWKDKNKDKASDTPFEGSNAAAYVYVE